jgi:hypothetical protein
MLDRRLQTKRRMRAALGAALGIVLLIGAGAGAAHAEDDDEDTFEQKIFKKLFGLTNPPEIDYRERSPLVVPPSRDLPPPDATATINNPAWPVDAEIKRRKEAKSSRAKYKSPEEDARALTPEELNRGRLVRGRSSTSPRGDTDGGKPLSPSELGYQGGVFSTLFGGKPKEEVVTFAGEPPRESLIDPPPGYRTPSPAQPYGLAAEKFKPKASKFEDRGITQN